MEALKSSLRTEVAAQQQSHGVPSEETTAWVVENGELFGDGFLVDELLDLEEFGNDEEDVKEIETDADAKVEQMETENNKNAAVAATASSSPSPYYSALSVETPPSLLPLSEISLLPHDADELEWVSFITDDSCSEFPTGAVALFQSIPKVQTQSDSAAHLQTPHPYHVAAAATQGASCPWAIVNALSAEAPFPARAKRSKRSRTAAVSWSSLPFTDSSSSTTTSSASCSSASSLSSRLIYEYPAAAIDESSLLYGMHPSLQLSALPKSKKQKVPKKRGRKPKDSSVFADAGVADHPGEQRCTHCGVKKTPQWRAGPLGAKTLCNACGVRFKSGRLLPEYRPACSPTFQISIHSNSHRKVLEMRRKKEALLATAGLPPIATC